MRLWSIHPDYLDSKGLVALWREGLLAQNVLLGRTKGYLHHPQLLRFRETGNPAGAIASYLRFILIEADNRGYHFNKEKIINRHFRSKISVTRGQIEYEYHHLMNKLIRRDPESYKKLNKLKKINVHPMFKLVNGQIESWEKTHK